MPFAQKALPLLYILSHNFFLGAVN